MSYNLKKILLVELESKGHHFAGFLNAIIKQLILRDVKIYLLTCRKNIKFLKNNEIFDKKINFIFCNNITYPKSKNLLSFLKFQFQAYNLLKTTWGKNLITKKFDFIYLNNMDHYDKMISIFGSPFGNTNVGGLFLNPSFINNISENYRNFLKKKILKILFLKLFLIKKIKRIFIIDPIAYSKIKNSNKLVSQKLMLVNDIGTSNVINITNKKDYHSKKKFRILVFGSIRKDKSIDTLLETLKYKFSKKIEIIIAGAIDNETKTLISTYLKDKEKWVNELKIYDKFISFKMEKNLFLKSNLIWTGFKKNKYASSGVFFQASLYKKPVITCNHGLVNFFNNKYKIGKSINLENQKLINSTIEDFIKKKISVPDENFEKLNKAHNSNQVAKSIVKSFIQYFA